MPLRMVAAVAGRVGGGLPGGLEGGDGPEGQTLGVDRFGGLAPRLE